MILIFIEWILILFTLTAYLMCVIFSRSPAEDGDFYWDEEFCWECENE
jgi:hypothetical protein